MSPLEIIVWLIVLFLVGQFLVRVVQRRHPHPVPPIIGRFLDSDVRRLIQPTARILARSGIGPGMQVLEVGCGSGCFTTGAARFVGPAGLAVGIDLQAGMLAQAARKSALPENRDIVALELVRGDACALPFRDEVFDAAFMVSVLPEIPDYAGALAEVRRVLKPGGTLAVSEFLIDTHFPPRSTTVRLGEEAGFSVDALEGLPWNYTIRFEKPGEG